MARAAPAAKATASKDDKHTLDELLKQIEKASKPDETLKQIVVIYERFLYAASLENVVSSLNALIASEYLEKRVWPLWTHVAKTKSTADRKAWLLTILLLVIRSEQTASSSWTFFTTQATADVHAWDAFVQTLLDSAHSEHARVSTITATKKPASHSDVWTLREKTALLSFLSKCYAHLDVAPIATHFLKLVSLPVWSALSSTQRELEFEQYPKLARHWRKLMGDTETKEESGKDKSKRRKVTDGTESHVSTHEKAFIDSLVQEFVAFIATSDVKTLNKAGEDVVDASLRYVATSLVLWTDILGQLPTRRFLLALLRRRQVLPQLRQSPLIQHWLEFRSASEQTALRQQIQDLELMLQFAIDPQTGKSLTSFQEQKEAALELVQTFQRTVFEHFRDTPVEALAILPVSAIQHAETFREQLSALVRADRGAVEDLGVRLGVFADKTEASALTVDLLVRCLVDTYALPSKSSSASEQLFPTEIEIWRDDLTDTSSTVYTASPSALFPVLALPKLGLQYLNLADFLRRNATLSRHLVSQSMRSDLESAIRSMDAVRSLARNGETVFRGFSQRAVPLLTAFSIMKVDKPAIGETVPSLVVAQFDVELDTQHDITAFDRIQPRELVYLVTIRPLKDEASEAMGYNSTTADESSTGHFAEDFGVMYVRCAEVLEVLDEDDVVLHVDDHPQGKGRKRAFKVALDGEQYKKDLEDGQLGAYEYTNLLVRRNTRTHHSRAVLETIASTLKEPEQVLPSWLYDLVLGYGDPAAATYSSLAKSQRHTSVTIPLLDLFVDGTHAVSTCGANNVTLVDENNKPLEASEASAPFTLVEDLVKNTTVLKAHRGASNDQMKVLTKAQVTAVKHGVSEGLTLVQGAHTATQDVVTSILQTVYRSTPTNEKILVVTQTQDAVKSLLTSLEAAHKVDIANIVALTSSAKTEDTTWSIQGRVGLLLQRRLYLLQQVDALAKWMERLDAKYAGLGVSASYSSDNALFFYRYYLKALLDAAKTTTSVQDTALRSYYVEKQQNEPMDASVLHAFAAEIEGFFGELERLQSFELLHTPRQRADAYLIQHARVLVLTAEDAAIQYRSLAKLRLSVKSVVALEASCAREIETFLPLLLTTTPSSQSIQSGLKRLVLVSDNESASKQKEEDVLTRYAGFSDSLLSRLLRLGVQSVTVDAAEGTVSATETKATKKPAPPTTKKTPTKTTPSKKRK
ncbi:hypothetical protein Poli38472_012447 [Pythium oligandrum]|uniref:Intron-binding protein aquarius N-terminal domain-containing protein n=1 Tax=Pythium oligandrum TaxID=41045 RepID=A0A8K1CRG8_PYTOL|nr:hypothetical protein Poli38472_012447 [Pythium oligandrum]|eukprot:TMW67331.1 hypothetical protein Poli38472_012447 [Pythium oligandrum]